MDNEWQPCIVCFGQYISLLMISNYARVHQINICLNIIMQEYAIRGLFQKVVDFLYNKKTIQSIAIKFYL